ARTPAVKAMTTTEAARIHPASPRHLTAEPHDAEWHTSVTFPLILLIGPALACAAILLYGDRLGSRIHAEAVKLAVEVVDLVQDQACQSVVEPREPGGSVEVRMGDDDVERPGNKAPYVEERQASFVLPVNFCRGLCDRRVEQHD